MVDWNRESKRYRERKNTDEDRQEVTPSRTHYSAKRSSTSRPSRRPPKNRAQRYTHDKETSSASERLRAQLDALDETKRPRGRKSGTQRQKARCSSQPRPSHQQPAKRAKGAPRSPRASKNRMPVKETKPMRVFTAQMLGYVIFFLVLCIGFGLWASPLSRLSGLKVAGNQLVSADTALADSGLHPNMSLLDSLTSERRVNRSLKAKHSNIKNTSLDLNGRELTLQVQEYQPVAKVYINGELYPVFENQKVLALDAGDYLEKVPLLESFSNGQIERLAKGLQQVPDKVKTNIKRITNIEDDAHPERIAMEMKDGNIITSRINIFGDKMGYYPGILKELEDERGLIDMEVGIYYEPLTPLNNPYATPEEKKAYQEMLTPTTPESESSGEREGAEITIDQQEEQADDQQMTATSQGDVQGTSAPIDEKEVSPSAPSVANSEGAEVPLRETSVADNSQ